MKIIACRVEHCLGCRSCELACAVAHSESKDLRGALAERSLPQRRVTVERAGAYGLPLQCRHCEDGLCQLVCPTGALHHDKAKGLTLVDEDLCIGCKLCTLMCPLGVLRIGDRGRAAMKCDQCAERQSEGQPPACVAACPTRALQFVERESLATGEQHLAAVSVVAALTGGAEVEEDLAAQSRRRKAVAKPGGKPRRVVVIGANAAGAMAALHAADIGAKVTLIAAEEFSYRRPAIPALISGHIADISEARIYPREMFEKHGIEVRAPARAVAVDTAKKTVTVEAGGKREAISYDSCVLATGGTAARARIPGTDKRGVCTFTTSEGAHEIIRQAADAKAAVVIGAGFIALEVAQALLEKGLKVYFNVRSRILRRLVEPDISAFLEARFEQRGLTMLTGESINEIGGGDAVEFVVHQGKKIPVQLVVLGTGVSPNVALAKAAGLRLAESGAIAVDHHMRTSDPNVYAAGDCAEVPDATTGQFIYSAVGSTGALAGTIAGQCAAGADVQADGFQRAQADCILGLEVYSIGHSTTTAAEVGLDVKVYDLPTPLEVDHPRDEVVAKLLTDGDGRIVGAQAVAYRHGSQYAWQLYRAVLAAMPRESFLKVWMSPRRRAARLAEEKGFGELVVDPTKHK